MFTPVGGVLPPYLIFKTLPAICPEKLPGGYASLGLIFEPGHDLPIGVSRRRRLGLDQVGVNCAACHTGTVRTSAGALQQIVLGMPAHQLNLEGFFQFVQACSLDDRLTAGNVIAKAEESGTHVSLMQRLLLSLFVIQRTKLETLSLRNRIGPLLDDPTLPRGVAAASTLSIRTRPSSSTGISPSYRAQSSSAPRIFHHSGTSSRARECTCTGMGTTPRSTSAI